MAEELKEFTTQKRTVQKKYSRAEKPPRKR